MNNDAIIVKYCDLLCEALGFTDPVKDKVNRELVYDAIRDAVNDAIVQSGRKSGK